MATKIIFPMTRIHEPMRVDVEIQGGRVVDAHVGGMLFRGFEQIMAGRDPRDASLFVQRICGICSSAHALAANMAQQQAFKVTPTLNGEIITNLIIIADLLQNHLRHFYVLALYDYVKGPDMAPYIPRLKGDYRLPAKLNDELLAHARDGIEVAAHAHEMMAVFGAKAPHQQTIMPTGVTEQATSERIMLYSSLLNEIKVWLESVHLADVMTIAEYYKDYYNIGGGYGNLLSYGMIFMPITKEPAFSDGVVTNRGPKTNFDSSLIGEEVRYSWYRDDKASRHPTEGVTIPNRDKAEAYTWVKSPRYQGQPFESGPLARAWMNGDRRGVSVMDRLVARARETVKLCRIAETLLQQLVPGGPTLTPFTPPPQGQGAGLTDTMRGALGHWLTVEDYKIKHYQIVTPTAWNFSPRDTRGVRGPVEEALIGTPVADQDSLIEVGRVIRSFDPCFTCAIHVVNATTAKPLLI